MELYSVEDGKLKLNFHPGQTAAWLSTARFVFVLSGAQGGKTSFIPFWMFKEVYGMGDYEGCGPGDYLAVSSTYDLFKLKFLPEMLKIFVDLFNVGRYYAGDKFIELKDPTTGKFWAEKSTDPMWARIILRSADSKGGLESSTANAAVLDEVGLDSFTLENWESIQSRLALNQGRVLATTTLYNLGWLKTEVYDQWKEGDKTYDVIQFQSKINPAFSDEEYYRLKSRMTESKFALRYEGQFARPSGMIYKDFSDQFLVDPFKIPDSWPRVVGLDFGGANTCKLWMAENPDDSRWYIYDCSLSGDMTTREHVEETRENLADIEDFTLIGGSPSETQQRIDWIDNGLDVLTPSISNVEAGIDRVTELFKTDRIRVFRSLRGFRDEIGRYSRKLDSAGEPTHIISNKRKFHRLDALRYAGVYITDCDYDVESGNLAEMIARMRREG